MAPVILRSSKIDSTRTKQLGATILCDGPLYPEAFKAAVMNALANVGVDSEIADEESTERLAALLGDWVFDAPKGDSTTPLPAGCVVYVADEEGYWRQSVLRIED